MTSDNDRQCSSCVNLRDRLYKQDGRLVTLMKKYGQLKKALVQFGVHSSMCGYLHGQECDCGLRKAQSEHDVEA